MGVSGVHRVDLFISSGGTEQATMDTKSFRLRKWSLTLPVSQPHSMGLSAMDTALPASPYEIQMRNGLSLLFSTNHTTDVFRPAH